MSTITPDGQLSTTWYLRAGASFLKHYQWKTGTPAVGVDLTGWVARCQLRDRAGVLCLELTTENGGLVIDAAGNVEVTIAPDEATALLAFKKVIFDLELEAPSGFVRNLVGGGVVVGSNVTVPVGP